MGKWLDEENTPGAGNVRIDFSSLDPRLLAATRDIASLVREAGGRALMVGGSVRDLMLGGIEVKDIDIEVFGVAPDILQQLLAPKYPFDACGVSFGVLKVKGLDIDVALPRRESKLGEGHRAFAIASDPSLSVFDASTRRDFTINAMYCDPLTGEVEDPHGGRADLEQRILRHVSPKFAEDPLRVLRGMQFVARFGLTPAPETIAICRTIGIEGLAPERLFEEWAKLLTKGVAIGKGLEFLKATGWLQYFPELAALVGCEQDPAWHPEGDVWEHTKLCLDAFARRRTGDHDEDLVVGLAVVCHDFGKPATTKFDPATGRIRSLGHDEAGREPTLSFLKRITNEERLLKEVPPLVACHMQPFALWKSHAGDAAIRRLALKVVRVDRLIRVARADSEGRPIDQIATATDGAELEWLAAAAERLRIAAEAPKPILQGRHLIALGYRPSPQFGAWLKAAFEAQLDGAFSDLDGALAYFRSYQKLSACSWK